MKIHALASLRHYRRHVEAVWRHLPEDLRGEMIAGSKATTKHLPKEDIVMVGGWYDIDRVPQRVIYCEHGAGQSYGGDRKASGHPAYHGSKHPERVMAYISPSQRVADSWDRPAFAAGCPALDIHSDRPLLGSRWEMTAAITFHWDARKVCPEAWSARNHYISDLHAMVAVLRQQQIKVIGHWHPRDRQGPKIWKYLKVEQVGDVDEVLRRSQLLIVDNSSVAYEAAALDISVISLNAPWYRRDVEHGLRFWDHVPGAMIDDVYDFARFHHRDYVYRNESAPARQSAAEYAYALKPGHAGEMAAAWVTKLVTEE